MMREPNDLLRQARLRLVSPSGSGRALSRQELAEAVNAWLFEHVGRVSRLDAEYVGQLERGWFAGRGRIPAGRCGWCWGWPPMLILVCALRGIRGRCLIPRRWPVWSSPRG